MAAIVCSVCRGVNEFRLPVARSVQWRSKVKASLTAGQVVSRTWKPVEEGEDQRQALACSSLFAVLDGMMKLNTLWEKLPMSLKNMLSLAGLPRFFLFRRDICVR